MTTQIPETIATAFRDKILSARTAALAARGAVDAKSGDTGVGQTGVGQPGGSGLLPERLVCETGGRLYGLEPAAIEAVRPFRCHALPLLVGSAVGTVLGIFNHGGHLASVLDLGRLLGNDDVADAGGTMLLLRGTQPGVALRVDRVLGLLAVRHAGDVDDRRHAVLVENPHGMPDRAPTDAPIPAESPGGATSAGRLVILIDQPVLRAAILSLDPPIIPSDPTGA